MMDDGVGREGGRGMGCLAISREMRHLSLPFGRVRGFSSFLQVRGFLFCPSFLIYNIVLSFSQFEIVSKNIQKIGIIFLKIFVKSDKV